MIASASNLNGIVEALVGGAVAVGIALFGTTFRLGTAIGRLSEAVKTLLVNDAQHDRRDSELTADIREVDRRVSRLEGYREGDRP